MRKFLLAALLLCPLPAHAGMALGKLGWEVSLQTKAQKKIYHAIAEWMLPPSPTVKMRPRIVVEIDNSAGPAVAAVVMRYAFSAKLRPIQGPGPGVWGVPFQLEERRIPNIKGGAKKDAELFLNRVQLANYLKRMHSAGFWPEAFRVQVMLDPHAGEALAGRISESELPVRWRANGNADE